MIKLIKISLVFVFYFTSISYAAQISGLLESYPNKNIERISFFGPESKISAKGLTDEKGKFKLDCPQCQGVGHF